MYRTIEDFRTAKRRARQERDMHNAAIEDSLAALQNSDTRGSLLRDAVGDVLRSWGPYRTVSELLHGRVSGSTVQAAGMALASVQGTWKKRLIFSGITSLLSKLMGDKSRNVGSVTSIADAIGDFANGMRARKAARERARAEETSPVDVA